MAGLAALLKVPPFHTMVLPALVPVSAALSMEQLRSPELEELSTGGMVLLFITTVDVLVHPFVALVAVTVYVPAAVTVAGLAALLKEPPFQTIAFPALIPVSVELVTLQLRFPLPDELTDGGIVLLLTTTVDVLVHPLEALVAVTVYVPAAVTVAGLAALLKEPPFHTMVFPALIPVSVELVTLQVRFPLPDELTAGGVVLALTTTVEVLVHPLEASVAVTVYVPAAVTEAGFAALLRAPPFHTIVLPALTPVNVAEGVEQFILLLPEDVTEGGVVLIVAATVAVFTQPVLVFVTVTV